MINCYVCQMLDLFIFFIFIVYQCNSIVVFVIYNIISFMLYCIQYNIYCIIGASLVMFSFKEDHIYFI